jgi:hypothetical protein
MPPDDRPPAWADAPYVFVELPSCPHCGTARRPIVVRSEAGGDGSVMRKCVCRRCSGRYRLVLELPATGNPAGPPR